MNILHIVQGDKGGTMDYIDMLIKNSNYTNYIICDKGIYDFLTNKGYNTYKIKMVRSISPINDLKSVLKIFKYILKNNIDIIYCHSSKAGALGRIVSLLLHKKCIYNPHGWAFTMKTSIKKQRMYEIIERFLSKFCKKIVTISQFEYQEALKHKICNKRKLILINNGIDIEKFSNVKDIELKNKLNIPNDYKIIGMCGRLTEAKSPITFVKVAQKVINKYEKCVFLLIGDGELRDKIQIQINDTNLDDKIIITGWTNQPEKYISVIDIGVLTSQWEGFGLSLVEYKASKKPIVASRVGGISNVVRENIDGFLCDPDDVEEFSGKILELLNNKEIYNNFSKAAFIDVCTRFDFNRVVNQHEKLYNSIISE